MIIAARLLLVLPVKQDSSELTRYPNRVGYFGQSPERLRALYFGRQTVYIKRAITEIAGSGHSSLDLGQERFAEGPVRLFAIARLNQLHQGPKFGAFSHAITNCEHTQNKQHRSQ